MRTLGREITCALVVLFLLSVYMVGRAEVVQSSAPPDERVLDTISRLYEPVVFPHAMHLDIAENCGTCHHQHGHLAGTPTCGRCHQLTPEAYKASLNLANMASCSTCHPASINVDNPGTPTLQAAYHIQCLSCHGEADDLQGNPKNCTEVCHERKKTAAN